MLPVSSSSPGASSESGCRILIGGSVADGYESVRALFDRHFRVGRERNAQLCVYVAGECVVDLWGTAIADQAYNGDTLQIVFNSTMSLTAIAIACLVDRGLLQYDEKVSKYWPEFGQNGKEDIRIEDIMRHEAGLAYLSKTIHTEDMLTENIKKDKVSKIIEKETLKFPPKSANTKREYHGLTRGWILNEIFRRVDKQGRTIGEFVREEISRPLSADAYIGITDAELGRSSELATRGMGYVCMQGLIPQKLGRKIEPNLLEVAAVMKGGVLASKKESALDELPSGGGAANQIPQPEQYVQAFNRPEVRKAELPSVNGSCSARGLAKIAACIAAKGQLGGVTVLSEAAVDKMHDNYIKRKDVGMLGIITEFSQGGVCLMRPYKDDSSRSRKLKERRSGFVGWSGYGGSVFQWHPQLQIGFAYIPTLISWYDVSSLKAGHLQQEVVKCVHRLYKNKLQTTDFSEDEAIDPNIEEE